MASWITALKSGQIRSLIEGGALQLGLFDERNLFELADPKYPDERLIACRNAELARSRDLVARKSPCSQNQRLNSSILLAGKEKLSGPCGNFGSSGTAGCGTARPVVWEGGERKLTPYPIAGPGIRRTSSWLPR